MENVVGRDRRPTRARKSLVWYRFSRNFEIFLVSRTVTLCRSIPSSIYVFSQLRNVSCSICSDIEIREWTEVKIFSEADRVDRTVYSRWYTREYSTFTTDFDARLEYGVPRHGIFERTVSWETTDFSRGSYSSSREANSHRTCVARNAVLRGNFSTFTREYCSGK